jgi:hypothetical protein
VVERKCGMGADIALGRGKDNGWLMKCMRQGQA